MATSSLPARSLRRLVQTTDVDQVRQTFAKIYSTTVIEPARNIPFGYTLDIVSIGAVHITEDNWSSGGYLAAPGIEERYILSFSAKGVAEGTIGDESFIAVPGRSGMLFSAQQPSTLTIGMGYRAQNITIDRAAIEAHLTALTGQALPGPIRFAAEMDLTQCSGAAIYNVAQLFRREAERPDASRLVVASLRDALFTAVLTGQPHNASPLLGAPMPRVTPGCVRKAEEYMTAHAGEPITLEDIVTAVGVPARSLQATFQSHRGTTPMAFLRDRRLELAQKRLLSASPTATVGGILRDLGTTSPGRFSGEYTKRFGESPSETLARAAERQMRRGAAR